MRPGCTLTNFCDFVGRYMQAHPSIWTCSMPGTRITCSPA